MQKQYRDPFTKEGGHSNLEGRCPLHVEAMQRSNTKEGRHSNLDGGLAWRADSRLRVEALQRSIQHKMEGTPIWRAGSLWHVDAIQKTFTQEGGHSNLEGRLSLACGSSTQEPTQKGRNSNLDGRLSFACRSDTEMPLQKGASTPIWRAGSRLHVEAIQRSLYKRERALQSGRQALFGM